MTSSKTDEHRPTGDPAEERREREEGVPGGAAEGEAGAGESRGGPAQSDAEQGDGSESGDSEVQALRDRYLRLAAEYDNFRKRTERERGESWARAQAQIVERLLDALDDLQRVAHYAPSTSMESLLEGVQMVERKLLRALEGAGLEVVDAVGQPFDPSIHDAIMMGEAEDGSQDETVGQVLQKGYRFNGVLLRPARVQVRKYQG